MAPRRWLWPCSDSHVLRLPAYQKPSLHSCLVHPDHPDQVLVADSHHLDDDLHSAKRRRIESIAHAYLSGQPIYIPSATLKGPFPADKDLSICHDPLSSPDATPVSPPPTLTADSFIRRRPEHKPPPESISPDPARTPSRPRHSSAVVLDKPASRPRPSHPSSRTAKNKSLQSNLPSSAVSAPDTDLPPLPKFVSINQVLAQARPTSNQLPTSTAPARSFPSPRVRIPDTDFISPSPSPSRYDASPTKAAVLRQRPASSLNRVEKAPPSANKLPSVEKNKRPIKRVYQAAAAPDTSPFIYRKNAVQGKNPSASSRQKSTEPDLAPVEPEDVVIQPSTTARQSKTPVSPQKRHHVLFGSAPDISDAESSNAPSTAVQPECSPERPSRDLVPAINMSFGQESLGMNFDIVNHFDTSLPAPPIENKIIDVNQGDQQPPTATVTWNLDTEIPPQNTSNALINGTGKPEFASRDLIQEDTVDGAAASRPDQEREMMHGSAAKASLEPTGDPVDDAMEDTVIDDLAAEENIMDELPYISTQAAMQDAHRALFDASSPVQPPEERFELPVETPARHATSSPPSPVHAITPFHQFNAEFTTDTQAPLPNTQALFDGFYSPIKLSGQKPRATKRASFVPSVILEDADDTVASILDFSENGDAREINHDGVDLEQNDEPTNGQHLSPDQSVLSPTEDQGRTSASLSDSPDIILSQRPPASTRDSVRHSLPALQTESVSLSEMLDFVSKRTGIDVDTLLSQATPTSSSRSANNNGRESGRSSRVKPRSSLPKPAGSSQSKRPRSSLPKSLPERRVGQRRSTRLSLSQPNPQVDGANDDDDETDFDIDGPSATQPQLTQPRLSFAGLNNSFALVSFGVPDGSSTIPDPSLAFNHAQQNATPASEKLSMTPGSAPQSTGPMSSFQHAQKQYSSLTDLDSTMPDLPQTFSPPVR
ncbi:hypothetical protein M436DRAFT_54344 [Aureobasidium namibiae CBS 147.97]|uniref:Uncharacterized protein n=1 Tax=Aureobasidium namibiae CBS 147.97 TaxID=1043004 RepID=A0A074WAZ5_9PEZI